MWALKTFRACVTKTSLSVSDYIDSRENFCTQNEATYVYLARSKPALLDDLALVDVGDDTSLGHHAHEVVGLQIAGRSQTIAVELHITHQCKSTTSPKAPFHTFHSIPGQSSKPVVDFQCVYAFF